jgi:predicted RNA-binding Zn-ribbon protein involved in translation (DUF1610 family)
MVVFFANWTGRVRVGAPSRWLSVVPEKHGFVAQFARGTRAEGYVRQLRVLPSVRIRFSIFLDRRERPILDAPTNSVIREFAIPYWFFVPRHSSYPIYVIRKERIRRTAVARNLCASCGYDLRATTDRCPECGMIKGNGPTGRRITRIGTDRPGGTVLVNRETVGARPAVQLLIRYLSSTRCCEERAAQLRVAAESTVSEALVARSGTAVRRIRTVRHIFRRVLVAVRWP